MRLDVRTALLAALLCAAPLAPAAAATPQLGPPDTPQSLPQPIPPGPPGAAPNGAPAVAPFDPVAADCSVAKGCEAKFCQIQAELDEAQAAGLKRKAAGLRTALAKAHATCTDASLAADHARLIRKKEDEVGERRADFVKANKSGKEDKIEKARRKLQEAESELSAAQADAR